MILKNVFQNIFSILESRTRSIRGIKMATIVPINRAEGVVYVSFICFESYVDLEVWKPFCFLHRKLIFYTIC